MELNFCDRGIPLRTEVLVLAASKLSKYVTALSAYNVKSFTYEINQDMHEHTHTHKHTHTHTHTHTPTHTPHTNTRARAHARSHTHAHTST